MGVLEVDTARGRWTAALKRQGVKERQQPPGESNKRTKSYAKSRIHASPL